MFYVDYTNRQIEMKSNGMRIKKHSIIRRSRKAVTLIELIVAMTLMVIIFTAMVPQFYAIRTSWANNEVYSTLIQNGMVLDEHINRNLSAAKQLISVSPGGDPKGYIIYKDTAGIQKQYMVRDGNVVFGTVDSEEPLAGPVSRFQVSGYSLDNFDSNTTDANTIRFVEIQTDLTISDKTKTFTTSAYLKTNASGIVGCWKMDANSGTIAKDSSGNGNDGTIHGTPTWGAGQINGALTLNGTDNYVYLGTDSSLNFRDSEPFTITAWINTRADEGLIVSLRNSDECCDGSDIDFAVGNDGGDDYSPGQVLILVRQDSGGQWASVISGAPVNDANWHHVAAVRTGNTVELFVDGNSQGKNSGAQAGGAITTNVRAIGCEVYWGEDSSCFNGTIDDVRIYNRALSKDEIEQLANVLRYRVPFTAAKVSLSE